MTSERIVYSVLGIEVSERRSLEVDEKFDLDARVSRALRAVVWRWLVRVALVATPIAMIAWSIHVHGPGRGDPLYYALPVVLGTSSLALMLFEIAEMRTPWQRQALYALSLFAPTAIFVPPFDRFEPLWMAFAAYWLFGFLFAFMAFCGRAMEDAWLVRALVPLVRTADPALLIARGKVTMDSVPRRFRELGVGTGLHEIGVLADSYAIVSIDGVPVESFPHVPIARVHIVANAEEALVEALDDRRVLERALTSGEASELRRLRSRAMTRAYTAAVPALFGVYHLAHFAHNASLLGIPMIGEAGALGLPLIAIIGVGVQSLAYLRFGRDLFARRVRVERLAFARSTDAPFRETLWHSRRPWTLQGVPDPQRLIPYD